MRWADLEPATLQSLVLPALFAQLAPPSAVPVRREAVRVICMQLRRLRTATHRADACTRLVRELQAAPA